MLLHVSLVLRVYGDLAGNFPARQWGGMLNEVAVLLFLITTIIAARMGPPKAKPVTR